MPLKLSDIQHKIERIDPIGNHEVFEDFCMELAKTEWGDPHAQRYGRSGQAQHGVDVLALIENRLAYGIQSKCRDIERGVFTPEQLRAEVNKAKTFRPKLDLFVVAHTLPRDAELQTEAANITMEIADAEGFRVVVWAWEDICQMLVETHTDLLYNYYPWLKGNDVAPLDKMEEELLDSVEVVSSADEYNSVRSRYVAIGEKLVDNLLYYQAFVYLLAEFYSDERGDSVREGVRSVLKISPEEEVLIIQTLKESGVLNEIGNLLYLEDNTEAKVSLARLLDQGDIDVDSVLSIC